jgi:HSP20 family protein
VDRPERQDPSWPGQLREWTRGDRWQPAIDIFETEKAIVVRVELAGVKSPDVRVTVDGERLRIHGERRPPRSPDPERLHQMEIAFGPFERVVHIAIPFERDEVAAHLEDGFLVVTLPKRAPARRRVSVSGD